MEQEEKFIYCMSDVGCLMSDFFQTGGLLFHHTPFHI
jgi:hypothetical protein